MDRAADGQRSRKTSNSGVLLPAWRLALARMWNSGPWPLPWVPPHLIWPGSQQRWVLNPHNLAETESPPGRIDLTVGKANRRSVPEPWNQRTITNSGGMQTIPEANLNRDLNSPCSQCQRKRFPNRTTDHSRDRCGAISARPRTK